jgi:hypothetical protein
VSTVTVPLKQRITPDAREVGLAVINRVLPTYAAGLHTGDNEHLQHEAERLETQESSPVIRAMRAMVDAERIERRLKAVTR